MLVRYGQNFRGVKVFIAQERGAAGVIIYSDPADDGWRRGDKYPDGPWRPDTGVQRGSVGFHVRVSGRPDNARRRITRIAARIAAAFSATVRADAKDSRHADLLSGCMADPSTSCRRTNAARVAGFLALHLSRRSGASAAQGTSQTGVSVSYALGCYRARQRQRVARSVGDSRQSSRRMGLRRSRSQQRYCCDARERARRRRTPQIRLEAEAHSGLLQLGRRGRRIDGLDRMGRAARSRSAQCRGIFQRRCRGIGTEVRRLGGSKPEAVRPRHHESCAQSKGRHCV